jgi:hypothetical protein
VYLLILLISRRAAELANIAFDSSFLGGWRRGGYAARWIRLPKQLPRGKSTAHKVRCVNTGQTLWRNISSVINLIAAMKRHHILMIESRGSSHFAILRGLGALGLPSFVLGKADTRFRHQNMTYKRHGLKSTHIFQLTRRKIVGVIAHLRDNSWLVL